MKKTKKKSPSFYFLFHFTILRLNTFKLFLLFICTFLFISVRSIAQKEGNFWFFGYNAGIDFNSGSPLAVTVGALSTDEGCASISDVSGNLLFYTDGVNVWNKLHTLMPHGTGLLGHPSSTQSAIIVPKPGSSTHYYIFTVPDWGTPDVGLCYSEIDLSLDSGLGDVVFGMKNIFLFGPSSEKVTAVKHLNGLDIWVIGHTNITDEYYVYSVTSAGVSATPVISAAGTTDTTGINVGYLKASPNGKKLANAVYMTAMVNVLDFNNSTGIVSYDFSIPYPAAPDPYISNIYSVEFSPNSKRLYVAAQDSTFSMFIDQYNMTLGSSAAIIASRTVIGVPTPSPGGYGNGALQNASDKKMYFAKLGMDNLSCIPYPDSLGIACGFVDTAIYLSGKISAWGLPNFITSFFRGSRIDFTHTCTGDSTLFMLADGNEGIDSIQWNFGDPASGIHNAAFSDSVFHVFSTSGSYTVTLIIKVGSVYDTSTTIVTILGGLSVNLGNDTSIYAGDSITLNAGPGYSYLWQDGSTNRTYMAAAGGTYYVGVTGVGPCAKGYDTIHISEIPEPVIPPDIFIPNVFTPNNDGKNDYLAFKNLEFYPGNSIAIYNRWGQQIYSNANYQNDWNGGGNSDGVYYFILAGPELKETIYGFVQLLH